VLGRGAGLALAALIAAASTTLAQEPSSPPPSVKERVLEKLRALEAASRPGAGVVDSVGVDSLAVEPTAAGAAQLDSAAADAAPDRAAVVHSPAGRPPAAGAPPDSAAADRGATAAGAPPEARGEGAGAPGPPILVHMPPDSFMVALRQLEGYTLTEYRAERARFDAGGGRLELIGKPELSREGHGMRSDSLLVYTERDAIICGYGSPILQGTNGDPVESDQICYNVETELGVALGARTKFSQSAVWFIHGQELYTSGRDRIYGADTEFTTCDLDEPHYHFRAKSMKVIHDQVMVARDVTLHFGDVPVFWLPFLAQSLKDGRRSGLLTPEFAVTDIVRNQDGYDRRLSNIGFFWAINDHIGSRVSLDWWSNHWTAVTGDVQFKWLRQFLSGNVSFSRFWRVDGSREFSIQSNASWEPDERTRLHARGAFVSSTSLVQRYSFDPEELNRSIDSNVGLSRRFDWGSVSLSMTRRQFLTDDRVDMTLPDLSINLSPITLFAAPGGSARWYNNATWSGSAKFNTRREDRNELLPGALYRDQGTITASASSSFSLGRLSWSQNVSFREVLQDFKPRLEYAVGEDSIHVEEALPRVVNQTFDWSTSLTFTQRLIGTSTFSPHISMGGKIEDSERSGGVAVAAPTRISMGASLSMNIFGFWPGIGPFSRFRHRIEPSLSYSYSPAVRAADLTDLQRRVFGATDVGEVNEIRLTIRQTFEAKYRDSDTASAAIADTAFVEGDEYGDEFGLGEPRRLPQARKVKLLSISTSTPLVWDFARGREPNAYTFRTSDLTHTINSDLLQGLSLTIGHDLFRREPGEDDGPGTRRFSPRLRSVNTSFTLDSNSWLFRVLGLVGRSARESEREEARLEEVPADTAGFGFQEEELIPVGSGGILRQPHESVGRGARQAVGSWRADLTYSLTRPEAGSSSSAGNQFLTARVTFQPTENWSVSWNTGYSFTTREFSDHSLTLTRDLHRWQANFDFFKAQNGNFMFRFRVHLLDNDQLKFRYNQRGESSGSRL